MAALMSDKGDKLVMSWGDGEERSTKALHVALSNAAGDGRSILLCDYKAEWAMRTLLRERTRHPFQEETMRVSWVDVATDEDYWIVSIQSEDRIAATIKLTRKEAEKLRDLLPTPERREP